MDPDEALANIRMLAAKIIELSDKDDDSESSRPSIAKSHRRDRGRARRGPRVLRVQEGPPGHRAAAQALDEWIAKGGFLPAAWRRPALDAAAVTEWSERKLVTLGLTMVEGQMMLRVQPRPGSKLAHQRLYAPTEGDPAVSVDALIAHAMRDLP